MVSEMTSATDGQLNGGFILQELPTYELKYDHLPAQRALRSIHVLPPTRIVLTNPEQLNY
jgi:hypothetical protein